MATQQNVELHLKAQMGVTNTGATLGHKCYDFHVFFAPIPLFK